MDAPGGRGHVRLMTWKHSTPNPFMINVFIIKFDLYSKTNNSSMWWITIRQLTFDDKTRSFQWSLLIVNANGSSSGLWVSCCTALRYVLHCQEELQVSTWSPGRHSKATARSQPGLWDDDTMHLAQQFWLRFDRTGGTPTWESFIHMAAMAERLLNMAQCDDMLT